MPGTIGPVDLQYLTVLSPLTKPSTDSVANVFTAISSGVQVTPPAGARIAVFSFQNPIYVGYGLSTLWAWSTASSAGSTGSAAEMMTTFPQMRYISSPTATTGITIGSTLATLGSITFYS